MIPLIPLILPALAAYYLLNKFFNQPEKPVVPVPSPLGPPYTPPFTGGQCAGSGYGILMAYDTTANPAGIRYMIFGGQGNSGEVTMPSDASIIASGANVIGAISGVTSITTVSQSTFTRTIRVVIKGVSVDFLVENAATNVRIFKVVRRGGLPDNCGNIPNPNIGQPIADNGLAESGDPDFDDADIIKEGVIPLNLGAILAAALAALRLATTIAEAVAAIADALDALKNLLEEDKPDEKEKRTTILNLEFGRIVRDGFIRLYPVNPEPNILAYTLDVVIVKKPDAIAKYFGVNSPNQYIYQGLGYIAFTSASGGIIERRIIEFTRQTFPIPEQAVAFYYHLGLEGKIEGVVSAIYQKEEQVPSE